MKRHRVNPVSMVTALGRRLSRSVALAASPKATMHGIVVVNTAEPKATQALFGVVSRALELIASTDSGALTQVRSNLKRIVIVGYPGSSYWPELKACALSRSTLENQLLEWTASVVVHEACHARLYRLGFDYRGTRRSRIERVCVRAQDRFLAKHPNTQRLRAHLANQLERGHGTDQEDAGRKATQLESLGVPTWIAKRF